MGSPEMELRWKAAKEITRLHELHLKRTQLTTKMIKERDEARVALGESQDRIIELESELHRLWPHAQLGDAQKANAGWTDEEIKASNVNPWPAHQSAGESDPNIQQDGYPATATPCLECQKRAVVLMDGLYTCLACGNSVPETVPDKSDD